MYTRRDSLPRVTSSRILNNPPADVPLALENNLLAPGYHFLQVYLVFSLTLTIPRSYDTYMFSLPSIHGRFPVGVTTFATPVRPTRIIGSAKLKNPRNSRQESTDHALLLEEVAFTAYYPADISSNPPKGVDWLFRFVASQLTSLFYLLIVVAPHRPLKESLLGLSTYLGVSTWLLWPAVYLFGSLIKVFTSTWIGRK